MRIDIDTVAFTTVSTGAQLAMVDLSGVEYAAVGVVISALAGGPTGIVVDAVPSDSAAGTNVFSGADVIGTSTLTTTGKYMLSRIGAFGAAKTQILAEGYLLPPPLKYSSIIITLSGGAAPTATGSVMIFKFTR